MRYIPDDPRTWPAYKPLIIAHDVGRSRDRSTAVVGGNSPYGRRLLGIAEAVELPPKLFGQALASELARVDREYHSNTLIVADVSNDDTYAEVLYAMFGQRAIGLHITRCGDGANGEWRAVKKADCRSTRSDAAICSICCMPNCKTMSLGLPTAK